MAIPRGHRFAIEFDGAFPQGLVLIGEVTPDNEYQTREDRAAGRPVRQKINQVTGKRQWKATVTDPDKTRESRHPGPTASISPLAEAGRSLVGASGHRATHPGLSFWNWPAVRRARRVPSVHTV